MLFDEKDVIELSNGVINAELLFWDNPNGGYEYTCPFCQEVISIKGNEPAPTMETFPHMIECVYFIAKDLLTGYNK